MSIQDAMAENHRNPSRVAKAYLEQLLSRVRNEKKKARQDVGKKQGKEWREKVEKWIDGNCREAYSLLKAGEKGSVHHCVASGRIPNILEEV